MGSVAIAADGSFIARNYFEHVDTYPKPRSGCESKLYPDSTIFKVATTP